MTRFIGLASAGNSEKKKWIYAFNITPIKTSARSDLVAQPADVTDIPFKAEDLNAVEVVIVSWKMTFRPMDGLSISRMQRNFLSRYFQTGEKQSQFFYDMNAPNKDNSRGGGGKGGGKRENRGDRKNDQGGGGAKKPRQTGPCWFCKSKVTIIYNFSSESFFKFGLHIKMLHLYFLFPLFPKFRPLRK